MQKPFNSPGGISVGATPITVISNTGAVTTTRIDVTNTANLGNVGNVLIAGGNPGQFLASSGNGSIYWRSTPSGNLAIYLRSGETLIPVSIPLVNQTLEVIGRSGNIFVQTVTS